MKKVLYALILMICLGGGLTVGIVRQRAKTAAANGGSDLVIDEKALAMAPSTGSSTAADGTTGSADVPPASDGSVVASASSETPMTDGAAPPAVAGDVDASDVSGRSFGSGTEPEPAAKKSSGSTGTTRVRSGDSAPAVDYSSSSSSYPDNTVIDAKDTGSYSGTEISDAPVKKGKAGKAAKAAPTAAPAVEDTVPFGDSEVDALPTVADTGTTDNSWDAGPAAPNEIAMVAPPSSAGGEIVFPKGSRSPAIEKISQKQSGNTSIVKIAISGQPKYRLFKVRNPSRVLIDIEETEIPGGAPSPMPGSTQQVKEITAKPVTNAGGLPLARIVIMLNSPSDKLPQVNHEYGNGGLNVTIGGSESF